MNTYVLLKLVCSSNDVLNRMNLLRLKWRKTEKSGAFIKCKNFWLTQFVCVHSEKNSHFQVKENLKISECNLLYIIYCFKTKEIYSEEIEWKLCKKLVGGFFCTLLKNLFAREFCDWSGEFEAKRCVLYINPFDFLILHYVMLNGIAKFAEWNKLDFFYFGAFFTTQMNFWNRCVQASFFVLCHSLVICP